MVKMEYIIGAVLVVLAIAVVGFVVYDQGMLKGITGEKPVNATPSPVTGDDSTVISQPVTAFSALSTVQGNSKFKDWKAHRTNVSVTDISSEACTDGLSTTWAITYISDGEQALVLYDSGRVLNIVKSPIRTDVLLMPKLVTGGMIDSDRAYSIAAGNMSSRGKIPIGKASLELSPGAQNTSNWDVICHINDGYYLVRIDSASGKVLESKQYNMG
jgi:hypothetical protein